jgi:hypothetical protein
MISPIGVAAIGTSTGLVIAAPAAEKVATISIQIAKNTNSHQLTCCRIYVASYTLSPIQEEDYLKSVPQKTIKFENYVYSNTGLTNIKPAKKCLTHNYL